MSTTIDELSERRARRREEAASREGLLRCEEPMLDRLLQAADSLERDALSAYLLRLSWAQRRLLWRAARRALALAGEDPEVTLPCGGPGLGSIWEDVARGALSVRILRERHLARTRSDRSATPKGRGVAAPRAAGMQLAFEFMEGPQAAEGSVVRVAFCR